VLLRCSCVLAWYTREKTHEEWVNGSCFCCFSRRGVTDKGLERPVVLTLAEANGFEKVDKSIGFPLVVVYPGYAFVVHCYEVINGVAGDTPCVGTTNHGVGLLRYGCCHMLFVT
jgi:hypothetical protein